MREDEYEDYFDDEGDPFLGSIVSAATRILPKAIPFVKRGIGAVGSLLRRSGARRAVRAVPRIAARTATSLARQARAGRRPTRRRVAATMARQTARALSNRRRLAQATRRRSMAARRPTAGRAMMRYPRPRRPYPRRPYPGRRYPGRRRRIVRPRYCVL
jgi:hypothetical protein